MQKRKITNHCNNVNISRLNLGGKFISYQLSKKLAVGLLVLHHKIRNVFISE
jgi:hypothetical protein